MTTLIQSRKNTTTINTGSRKVTLLHYGESHTGLALSSGATRANINLPATPTDGDVLTWDAATGKLVPTTPAAGGGSGTVTSVAITLPAGLSVAGSPITTTGTFAITFAAGYSIPTDANQANWTTAYGWGNHASAGYLAGADIGVSVQAYSAVLAGTTASFTTADETKLDGIEAGATADQSAAEILAELVTVDGAASGLDADLLDGNQASAFLLATEKGAANGLATLGADSKIPVAQLPAAVLGALAYQGTWNATTNSPTIPAASSDNRGYYYKVATAGSTNVDGITDWQVGDWIVSNGAGWDKVDNTELVSSVNGLAGAVVLDAGDVGAEPAITAGTVDQYWRGDKGWQDFAADVRMSVLSSAIAEGATTPDPGIVGATAWSTTLNSLVVWTGAAWKALPFKADLVGKVYLGTWEAGALKPTTTNGCGALAYKETATNKVMVPYLPFDPATSEHAQWGFKAPSWMDESATIIGIVEGVEPAALTTHGSAWDIKAQAQADGATLDSAWGTAQTVTLTTTSTTREFSAASAGIAPAGTWSAGAKLLFDIARNVGHGSDDGNLDVGLSSVTLFGYNTGWVEP